MTKQHLTKILTYLGSLPFLLLTACGLFGVNDLLAINISRILVAYGAIILSFVSGIHFAYGMLQSKKYSMFLVVSNVIALLTWVSLLIDVKLAVTVMIVGYICNLAIDWMAYQNGIIEQWFFNLRCAISAIVILCLIVHLWHIM